MGAKTQKPDLPDSKDPKKLVFQGVKRLGKPTF
jgi:hypothetical protein